MKTVAVLMILIGVAIGVGAVLEILYSSPHGSPFWVGIFMAPSAALFAIAGLMLWLRGVRVRQTVLIAALLMCGATIAATVFGVMGGLATLIGFIGPLVVVAWFWRSRNLAAAS